jgi:hypothetical protein
MPDLNIRKVDEGLLRAVNVAAARAGLTQRDFVIRSLARSSGWGNGAVEGKERVVEESVKLWPPVRSGGGTCAHGFPTHVVLKTDLR